MGPAAALCNNKSALLPSQALTAEARKKCNSLKNNVNKVIILLHNMSDINRPLREKVILFSPFSK
jgi:hypothetical protein